MQPTTWYFETGFIAYTVQATIYDNGYEDFSSDHAKAVELYMLAISRDNVDAMHNLGLCYEDGRGVERCLGKATALYKQAAALGHQLADEKFQRLLPKYELQTSALAFLFGHHTRAGRFSSLQELPPFIIQDIARMLLKLA